MKNVILFFCFLISTPTFAFKDSLNVDKEMEAAMMMVAYQNYIDSVENTFTFITDAVDISSGLADLKVPSGFKYLDSKSSEVVLTDIWGNPPSESLGMLFPVDNKLSDPSFYAINITYSEEGYIEDEDAETLDYDDLLQSMKEGMVETNKMRSEMGYETVNLIGWASPPFYDKTSKKLHWAKELNFEGQETNSLNYNIRILGRKGFLEMNVIGEMAQLPEIIKNVDKVVNSIEFKEGNRYADFNPSMDEVAAYGIGGLIAGKVLMKAGLLAKAGILLAKFWKVIAVALLAFGAGIKNLFGGKKKEEKVG